MDLTKTYFEHRDFIFLNVERVEKYFIRKKAFGVRCNSNNTQSEKLCKRMTYNIVQRTLLS